MRRFFLLALVAVALTGCSGVGYNHGGAGWNVGPLRQDQPEDLDSNYDPDDWIGPTKK